MLGVTELPEGPMRSTAFGNAFQCRSSFNSKKCPQFFFVGRARKQPRQLRSFDFFCSVVLQREQNVVCVHLDNSSIAPAPKKEQGYMEGLEVAASRLLLSGRPSTNFHKSSHRCTVTFISVALETLTQKTSTRLSWSSLRVWFCLACLVLPGWASSDSVQSSSLYTSSWPESKSKVCFPNFFDGFVSSFLWQPFEMGGYLGQLFAPFG